jgi:hypothetical protein
MSLTRGTGFGAPSSISSELAGVQMDHDGRIGPTMLNANSNVGGWL